MEHKPIQHWFPIIDTKEEIDIGIESIGIELV